MNPKVSNKEIQEAIEELEFSNLRFFKAKATNLRKYELVMDYVGEDIADVNKRKALQVAVLRELGYKGVNALC